MFIARRCLASIALIAMFLPVQAGAAPKGSNGGGKKGTNPPPPVTQTFTAPFAHAQRSATCSPETPGASCSATSTANTSGTLATSVALERTVPGVDGWVGQASAHASAVYQLTQPVTSVTAAVEIVVNEATIEHLVAGLADADVRAYASASNSACPACSVSSWQDVVQVTPGRANTVSNETVTLTLEMTNPQGKVPAGTLNVAGLIESWASLSWGVGRISSAADATLTRIVVTPHM